MPQITYHRFWCNTCQDFTLQHDGEGGACLTCGNVTPSYKMSEIPPEKLKEQRERYRKAKRDKTLGMYGKFAHIGLELGLAMDTSHIFDEVGSNTKIVEDDAGQKQLDELSHERWEEKRRIEKELKEEYDVLYKGTGRNDPCPCNSGLKYKRCCITKFNNV